MREAMLVIHFIGLAMALGAGFANLFLGTVASKLAPAERGSFMARISILGRMGQAGLGLLLLSGILMMTPYWGVLGEMPFLIAKLSLVAVLLASVSSVIIISGKARKQGNHAMLMRVRRLALFNFFIAIAIIILAVLTFR